MAVSDSTGPNGERDEPWAATPAAGGQTDSDDAADQPVELTDEAGLLDLTDDEPPLPWLQGDDDDEELEGSGIGQTVGFVVLGLLAIALVVGGIWWATTKSDDGVLVADGSTIRAPDAPYKAKPENPGGKVFEGTGDTSFGISEGQKRPARLGEASPAAKPGFETAKPADKGAASGQPAAPADVPGVGVQVAAYSNQQQAEEGWTRLSGQYQALSGIRHRIVQGQADIGTVYRLQAVAPDIAAAKALCQQLKSAGLNCQVKN